jgi:hypothetical protein
VIFKREHIARGGWHYALYGRWMALNFHTNAHRSHLRSGIYPFRTVTHPQPFGVMVKVGAMLVSLQLTFLKR